MISIIFPIYNERENIKPLINALRNVLDNVREEYELIAVDDGSIDGSFEELKQAAEEHKNIRALKFSRNFGQTAALSAGIRHAKGEIIVTIDSDLENVPEDIPRLIEKLRKENLDIVSGWRVNRWEGNFLTRKLPSLLANALISSVSGVKLHDYGCTLKAYRREIISDLPLYGEMHRFIPAYAYLNGAKIGELPVTYKPRRFGKSKYGFSRTFRVILDLLFMKFLVKYMTRPIHFFGGFGFISLFLGFGMGVIAVWLKLFASINFVRTPLPVLSAIFIIVGMQFILMGIIAEIVIRMYHESQQKNTYIIKERINC